MKSVILDSGNSYFYFNGRLHREDGPAIEYSDGRKEWFLNGISYSECDFNHEFQKRELNYSLQSKLTHKPKAIKVKI